MDDAGRRLVTLAQPALDTPDGVEHDLLNPPNLNALADGLTIAALIVVAIAVLVRIHFWVFGPKLQLQGRLEAVLMIGGFGSYIGYIYCLLHVSLIEVGWWVHQTDIAAGGMVVFSYWVYIAGLLYNSAIAPVKAAILIEWMRMFSPNGRNAFFWVCHGALWFNVAYYTTAIIVGAVRCTPRERIWNHDVGGTCLQVSVFEILSAINVVSDILLLLVPQFFIWRLNLSREQKMGAALMTTVGLFGTISAILQLVATKQNLGSNDFTYFVSPVCFWALGEMTSVFIIYGIPAIPTVFASTGTGFPFYCMQRPQKSLTGRAEDDSSRRSRSIGPWRERRSGPSKQYHSLDKSSIPDTGTTRCTSTIGDLDSTNLPESACIVVKTVEVRRDEICPGTPGFKELDIGEGVLLRQHPWAKL